MHESRTAAAALFGNLVFRSAFRRTFAPQFNFDFAVGSERGGPFCTLIGTSGAKGPRQMSTKVANFHPQEFPYLFYSDRTGAVSWKVTNSGGCKLATFVYF